jgi:hypothetical protein
VWGASGRSEYCRARVRRGSLLLRPCLHVVVGCRTRSGQDHLRVRPRTRFRLGDGRTRPPLRLMSHWLNVAGRTGMPGGARLWAEAPLSGTFPACTAVEVAAEQGWEAAYRHLRRIREGNPLRAAQAGREGRAARRGGPGGARRGGFRGGARLGVAAQSFASGGWRGYMGSAASGTQCGPAEVSGSPREMPQSADPAYARLRWLHRLRQSDVRMKNATTLSMAITDRHLRTVWSLSRRSLRPDSESSVTPGAVS